MPATALRHPDAEEIVLPVSPSDSSDPLSIDPSSIDPSSIDPSSPDSSSQSSPEDPHNIEWRSVAPYVDRFTGAEPATERAAVRRRSRRHKPFILSGAFFPATLVLLELMLLVGLYTRDLKMLRQEEALNKQIQQTSLQIALDQNELASYKSSPLLTQWAKQLGYRPIEAGDFDDVTSDAPLPAPKVEETR
jgi:hypothetical protein